jgi:hypothetical protein
MVGLLRHSQRKRRETARSGLRTTAPVFDSTKKGSSSNNLQHRENTNRDHQVEAKKECGNGSSSHRHKGDLCALFRFICFIAALFSAWRAGFRFLSACIIPWWLTTFLIFSLPSMYLDAQGNASIFI